MPRKLTTEEYIEKARAIYGDEYDYSKVEYKGSRENVCIICPTHGAFTIRADHFLERGCPECNYYNYHQSRYRSQEDYIRECNRIHENKYIYTDLHYTGMRGKVDIICPIHGKFTQIALSHIQGHGCPQCNESKGEKAISSILQKQNIEFIFQYSMTSKVNPTGVMYVDFYLPKLNIIIEYNGRQHYIPIEVMGGQLQYERQQARDEELRQYCKDNNIKLIEIRYDEDVWEKLNNEIICK